MFDQILSFSAGYSKEIITGLFVILAAIITGYFAISAARITKSDTPPRTSSESKNVDATVTGANANSINSPSININIGNLEKNKDDQNQVNKLPPSDEKGLSIIKVLEAAGRTDLTADKIIGLTKISSLQIYNLLDDLEEKGLIQSYVTLNSKICYYLTSKGKQRAKSMFEESSS